MTTLRNDLIELTFDGEGRLAALRDVGGEVEIPVDPDSLTDAFVIELRGADNKVFRVTPQASPQMEREDHALCCTWVLKGKWGELTVRGRVALEPGSRVSLWTLDVDNRSECAVWQVAYPRISGLTAFGKEAPDWLAAPFQFGEKAPNPVALVNQSEARKQAVSAERRSEYGEFNVEPGISYSYPGMWTMQFLAYGHPEAGGIYFGAHDSRALYKFFGLYADGRDGKHAALVLKQYPEDRTARGADFRSFYPAAVGVYQGEWWGASEIYRSWALQQHWCAGGPTRAREDVPEWVKQLDLWYWNWQYVKNGYTPTVVPAIKYLKQRFGCEMAFHWYGCNGEFGPTSYWRGPHEYPENEDIRHVVIEGVRELHEAGVHCIPYIVCRLWSENTRSFRDADGMKWVCRDEHGNSADPWGASSGLHSACPTAPPWRDVMRREVKLMMENCEMDGAYLDQVTSCYAVPCFNPDHDHAPGGHDHWHRGYRELMDVLRKEMRERQEDGIFTSESTIDCFLDLFDADLGRGISRLSSSIGGPGGQPIPLFHSVYHDYHMTYGTSSTFTPVRRNPPVPMEAFRYAEALCLVGGGQLMISGFFAGDENRETARPYLDYMETLTRAHVAARKWLNLGVWRPPLNLRCDLVAVPFSDKLPPKKGIPAILSGCFELDGELCLVLVNHTDHERKGTFDVDARGSGLAGRDVSLRAVYPQNNTVTGNEVTLPPRSAAVWIASAPERD